MPEAKEEKVYSVRHAFYADVEGKGRVYFTRENEGQLTELPAKVLKDKLERGLIGESTPPTKEQRETARLLSENSRLGDVSAAPDMTQPGEHLEPAALTAEREAQATEREKQKRAREREK